MMYNMTEQRIFSRNQRPVYAGNAPSEYVEPLLGPIRQPVPPPKQENKEEEKQKEAEEEVK